MGIHLQSTIQAVLSSRKGEGGQDIAEYSLLLGLIALIVIIVVGILGTNISRIFSALASEVSDWL